MTETEAKLMAARAEREALRIQLDAEREAHKATKAGLVEAEKVADEVRAFIEKCNAEQGKAFCAFCGEATERADIASHISACAAHPMRAVERERDSLKAQLAALTAEHEAAAKAAEEKIVEWSRQANLLGKALQRIHIIADDCSVSLDPEDDPLAEIQFISGDALDGIESDVGPHEAASIRASQEIAALSEAQR